MIHTNGWAVLLAAVTAFIAVAIWYVAFAYFAQGSHRFTASRFLVPCHVGPRFVKQDVSDFRSKTSIRR